MPSRFDELCRTHLDPHVDEHFGEPVRFIPMARTPNGRASPDLARTVTDTTAVVTLSPNQPGVELGTRSVGRRSNDLHSIVPGTSSQVSVQVIRFATVEDQPRQGDVVECAAGRFEVVSAQADGTGRITCHLSALRRPTP